MKPRETKDKACSEQTLRILSDVLLHTPASSEAQGRFGKRQDVLVEDSLSWGTHDVQTSLPLLTLHRMEYCLRWVWDAASASLMLIHSYPRPHVLVASKHGYIGSVADPRLFNPRVGDDKTKHILLQWACNRHLSMVELPNAARQTGKTEPGDLLHLRQGLLLDHSGMEGLSSRIIFRVIWTTEAGTTTFLWFLVFALWLCYLNGSLPCAVSSTWTWVNQLLTLVQ